MINDQEKDTIRRRSASNCISTNSSHHSIRIFYYGNDGSIEDGIRFKAMDNRYNGDGDYDGEVKCVNVRILSYSPTAMEKILRRYQPRSSDTQLKAREGK